MELSRNNNKKIKRVSLVTTESSSVTDYYLSVRRGIREPFYIHEELKGVLGDTYGAMVFQEQVMEVLVKVVGYTMEEADLIRSAIGKKKRGVILDTFCRIRETVMLKGWTKIQANELCDQIEAFSKYGFNKSHAAAYSYLGYITMYLKHHYKLEWWTSILNSHLGKEDKLRSDIRLLGDLVLPVSINKSSDRFEIKDDKIVTPLGCVKGIGAVGIEEILSNAPFDSVEDFVKKVDHRTINIGTVSALVKARAMDCLFDNSKPYVEARKEFLDTYIKLKEEMSPGKKFSFDEKFIDVNALDLFLFEKDTNLSFNKNLLENEDIVGILMKSWPSLSRTGKTGIPLTMDNKVLILLNIDVASGMLRNDNDRDFGMILIFEESSFKEGTSKRTGRPWKKMSAILSDGYKNVEIVDWDANSALRYPKGSLVYVKGELKQGFTTPVSMAIKEIQKIDS